MPFRRAPCVDFDDQPQFRWPAAKVGFELDDLYGQLHERFNTAPIFIQDAAAFHHDVAELAHRAESQTEFLDLLQQRRDQRLAEASETFDKIAVFLFRGYHAADIKSQIGPFLQLSRNMNLDCLLAFCASFLGPDEKGVEPSLDLFHPWSTRPSNKTLPETTSSELPQCDDTHDAPSQSSSDALPDTAPSSLRATPEPEEGPLPLGHPDYELPSTQLPWLDSQDESLSLQAIEDATTPPAPPSTATSMSVSNQFTPQSEYSSLSPSPPRKRKRTSDDDDTQEYHHKRMCSAEQVDFGGKLETNKDDNADIPIEATTKPAANEIASALESFSATDSQPLVSDKVHQHKEDITAQNQASSLESTQEPSVVK